MGKGEADMSSINWRELYETVHGKPDPAAVAVFRASYAEVNELWQEQRKAGNWWEPFKGWHQHPPKKGSRT